MTICRSESLSSFSHPAIVGAATPLVYVGLVALVAAARREPFRWQAAPGETVFVVCLLVAFGGLAAQTWRWTLRTPWLVYVTGLLVVPFSGVLPPNQGLLATVYVGFLLATLLEPVVRFPDRLADLFAGRVGRLALLAGLGHFVVGFATQVLARRLFWTELALQATLLWGTIYVVSALALVALGVLPVLLWSQCRLSTPAIVVLGWFAWGLGGTLTSLGSYPLSSFYGVSHLHPVPFPDYMLKWVLPMVILQVAAGAEWLVRSLWIDWRETHSSLPSDP